MPPLSAAGNPPAAMGFFVCITGANAATFPARYQLQCTCRDRVRLCRLLNWIRAEKVFTSVWWWPAVSSLVEKVFEEHSEKYKQKVRQELHDQGATQLVSCQHMEKTPWLVRTFYHTRGLLLLD